MNNIFGLMYENHRPKDLKIIIPISIPEVKDPKYFKEKISCERIATENKMAKTSNALPDHPFKFPLPKPIYSKPLVSENTQLNQTTKFRIHYPKCGHFAISEIAIPKENECLEILCECEYILGELFLEELSIT